MASIPRKLLRSSVSLLNVNATRNYALPVSVLSEFLRNVLGRYASKFTQGKRGNDCEFRNNLAVSLGRHPVYSGRMFDAYRPWRKYYATIRRAFILSLWTKALNHGWNVDQGSVSCLTGFLN